MTVINMQQVKEKKELKAKALKYAKHNNVSLQTAMDMIEEVKASETTATVAISEAKALDALKDAIPTHVLLEEEDELDKMARELGVDKIVPIKWNPDIPY